MNDKFDQLAKGLAQSVTRRGALKKFGVGLAGIALALLGLATKSNAQEPTISGGSGDRPIKFNCQCKKSDFGCSKSNDPQLCTSQCGFYCSQPH